METLKKMLDGEEVRGAVCSADGHVRTFARKGVIDLFSLVDSEPDFLRGGRIADRVIGRGAALLLVKGGVTEVFAYVMSEPAHSVLEQAGIKTSYAVMQPNIINRTGTDICPVEKLTSQTSDPDEAFSLIRGFLSKMKS
ncbi:MAG: DUF1893 domain-containing protein [Bacteroidales bacterium]|nr:DUF1893 domain-containing protein [Bacteroidales bacterium]